MDVGYDVLYLDESETKLTQDEIREKLHRMDVEHTQGKPKVAQLVFSNEHMHPSLIHVYSKFQDNHTVVLSSETHICSYRLAVTTSLGVRERGFWVNVNFRTAAHCLIALIVGIAIICILTSSTVLLCFRRLSDKFQV